MPVPIIAAGAAAVAARLAAKKLAQEAAKKAIRINTSAAKGRTIGSPVAGVNSKGKLKVVEYMTGNTVKGKIKNIKDTAQLVEHNAGSSKKITSLKYPPKNLRSINSRTNKPITSKVPVKPKANRTRSGNKAK
jgi:Flp pilus assembly protein TadG